MISLLGHMTNMLDDLQGEDRSVEVDECATHLQHALGSVSLSLGLHVFEDSRCSDNDVPLKPSNPLHDHGRWIFTDNLLVRRVRGEGERERERGGRREGEGG